MPPDIARCLTEQRASLDYLHVHGHDAGAAMGLVDWLIEEALIRLEMRERGQEEWKR